MVDDRVRFEAVVEPLAWGRNDYTILKVPTGLARAATVASTRRVEGTINGVEVNVGLNRADVIDDTFIYLGKPTLRRLDAALGDVVDCVLRPADPDHVPVPDDVVTALEQAGRSDAFARLRPAQRRQRLVPVEAAARAETRARRIRELVATLPPG